MFNAAIHGRGTPRRLSTDHDPLFEAHRWTANLRILEIDAIKTDWMKWPASIAAS
jgi:hypothetical protein